MCKVYSLDIFRKTRSKDAALIKGPIKGSLKSSPKGPIMVYNLQSDNVNGLITREAYQELILSMSSGDYGYHTFTVEYVSDFENVLTLSDLLLESEA